MTFFVTDKYLLDDLTIIILQHLTSSSRKSTITTIPIIKHKGNINIKEMESSQIISGDIVEVNLL